MITLKILVYIILIHFLGDFGLQTHDQAVNKSSSERYLSMHVGVYSLVWLFASYCILPTLFSAVLFSTITFICHWLTDYYTSRISKKFFEAKDFHNGFVVVGMDQLLHYIQLFTTYILIVTKLG